MTPNLPQHAVNNSAVEEKQKNKFTIHHIILNTPLRILLALGLMAIVLPCLIYVYVYSQRIFTVRNNKSEGSCSHNIIFQVPCGSFNLTEKLCEARSCCFSKENGCYHSIPSGYQYNSSGTYKSGTVFTSLQPETPFGVPSTVNLRLITRSISNSRLRIELWDGSENVTMDDNMNFLENNNYKFIIFQKTMFSVNRTLNDRPLLTTSRGPLIVSQNFLEWNFHMNTPYLYGLGEGILKPGLNKLLFNSEQDNFTPFIIAYDPDSIQYHAILFKSPGPLEIDITESNLIIVKALYSKYFFIELFTGPQLEDILKELRQDTSRSFPDWILGIHVCRQTKLYNITESVAELNYFLSTNSFPFDSHCYHENLMNLQNIDIVLRNSQILTAIEALKSLNKTFFVPLHLELEMNEKLNLDIMLRHPRTNYVYQGLIDNRTVVYIDWMNNNLNKSLQDIWQVTSSRMELIDGISLQGNWMKDESNNLKSMDPRLFQYIPEGLSERLNHLLPWNTKMSNSEDVILESINFISSRQINYLETILKDKLMMTSSFNLDIQDQAVLIHTYLPTWLTFRSTVTKIVSMGLNGLVMAGSQVCGDLDNIEIGIDLINLINEELCIRWYQFASMTPIFRIRSDRTPDKFSAYAMKLMNDAILRRYSLVSYFKTVLSSGPLLTPMFYHFPELMINATDIAEQFNIGQGLLVAPVLMAKATHKTIYFPDTYYEIKGGMRFESTTSVEFPVVESDLPIFVRAGFIIGLHKTENIWTIEEAQKQPLKLIIGLNCKEDSNTIACKASGNLTLNQNYSLIFSSIDETLKISITNTTHLLKWEEFCKTDSEKLRSTIIESITLYGSEKLIEDNEIYLNLTICQPGDNVTKLNDTYTFNYFTINDINKKL